ncbi:MAG: U32 family peptidase [Clostridia bacterium]|nr:U32 family peptidase [Clostridia bacterium]
MVELLAPVGDFECLKAAVQNGADCVYFGANMFSARSSAKNFDMHELEEAINYAKLRNVKTNLTLNILIKNDEFQDAFNLAKKAYEYGIDAIIVQDLGLAKVLIKEFPDLAIHASTQMSVHNLEGVKKLEKLGFKRVVLSRELSYKEIEHICKNSNVEIECFIHGALCISYSGQCLFSSMVGGRSGNRGRCAQPCRLPYSLIENSTEINKGYLLSPRDLCGLEYLPNLIKAGVSCLKIEGRMKTPEYVATVTRIYRKYIDMVLQNKPFVIDTQDKKDLMQVFNRGGFSNGHFHEQENRNLIFKEKPNNMGIFLGTVSNFNNKKGYVTLKLKDDISIGDKISIATSKEDSTYTVSELMINNKNHKTVEAPNIVTIGRMKGNIEVGNKIYKLSSKQLLEDVKDSFSGKELKRIGLSCRLNVKLNEPISITISDKKNHSISITSEIIPEKAVSSPITKERIISQLSKTNNTPFTFNEFFIDLQDGVYISKISSLNELRRTALEKYEDLFLKNFKRTSDSSYCFNNISDVTCGASCDATCDVSRNKVLSNTSEQYSEITKKTPNKISLLLNILNENYNYDMLTKVDRIYIPLKYFFSKKFDSIIHNLSLTVDTYIFFPCIMRNNYINLFNKNIGRILKDFKIKGFLVSNMGQFELLKNYTDYDLIANYNLNVYNSKTFTELNCSTVTLSPELSKDYLSGIEYLKGDLENKYSEIIVYGKLPLMNTNYCLLGETNKCYKSCSHKCLNSNLYYLKDRMGLLFRIVPDNIDTVTTIFNSKNSSISINSVSCDYARIDILDETPNEINQIIEVVKSGNRFEGKEFTNGNFNRDI